jgi:hypothetical protein
MKARSRSDFSEMEFSSSWWQTVVSQYVHAVREMFYGLIVKRNASRFVKTL